VNEYYNVRYKNTPKFIQRNWKIEYHILVIFGTNIPDTAGYQMTIYVLISLNVCFAIPEES